MQDLESDEITSEAKSRAKKVLKMFKQPTIQYSQKWRTFQNLQKLLTLLLVLFMVLRGDIFNEVLMCFYLCYAALFPLHIPYSFYTICSVAL